MIDGINDATEVIIGVCTAVALLATAYKVLWYGKRMSDSTLRPGLIKAFLLDLRGFRDAILGREPIRDSITGKELSPALPGIGPRMAHQEAQMEILTTAVARIADTYARVDDHERRLEALEAAAVERVVARAESTQAFRTIEAAIRSKPDILGDEPDLS